MKASTNENELKKGQSIHVDRPPEYKLAVTIDEAVERLNSALEADPKAIAELIDHRVPCNDELRDHPHVQVMVEPNKQAVGFLGVLNGIFGIEPEKEGYIVVYMDPDSGQVRKFAKMNVKAR